MPTKHLNLLLLSVVIVLAALLWRDLRRADDGGQTLTTLDIEAVREVRIERRGQGDIRLQRDADAWRMVAPWPARADEARVRRLLGLLSEPVEPGYAVADVTLADLGLAPPRGVLEVDGLRLEFGDAAPLSQRRYLRVGDRVHLLEDRYLYQVNARPGDFVDPRPLPPDATIDALHLPGLRLTRGEAGWRVEPAPDPERHSGDAAQILIDTWATASAMGVTRVTGVAADVAPVATIEIRLRDREAPLRLGLRRVDGGIELVDGARGLAWEFSQSAADALLRLPRVAAAR